MSPSRAAVFILALAASVPACFAQGATATGDGGSIAFTDSEASEADVQADGGTAKKPHDAGPTPHDAIASKHDAPGGADDSGKKHDASPADASDAHVGPDGSGPGDVCALTTCAEQGATCGNISDGCGSTLLCGVCGSPMTCGGGGTPGACGCTPTTCAAAGKNCGALADGCGGTLACGSCTVPETCAGAGTTGVCGAPCGILAAGSSLSPGASLVSCDGRFSLTMQPTDGNLVLYFAGAGLWSSNTSGDPGAHAVMQADGNFVVYDGAVGLWSSATAGNPGAYLALQSDGNLVVYSATNASLWSSGTCCH